ncbi:MAG: DUF2202 domain-containing protein [Anaerolineales bacterium]|nr:DUF2202 domain-containing protein [Anaerolineales bacterium]
MIGKLISYSLVGTLAIALVGGSVYILATDTAETPVQTQKQSAPAIGSRMAAGGVDPNNAPGAAAVRVDGQGSGESGREAVRGDSSGGGNADGFTARESTLTLTAEETAGLTALLEEEKLAHDVYFALYEKWDYAAFRNIADSEQAHMAALRGILERAGVSDPTPEYGIGEFPTPAFQDLYILFTTQGGDSLADALKAGGAIEEMDILDIEQLLSETDNPELLRVYENLRQGSINHLRAYSKAYEKETGATYIPQYTTQAEFDTLMTAESRGYQGGGQSGSRKGTSGA